MKKKEKIKQLKNKNGITLIALVVTIIVLIILAGVSISLVLGDNGIITKAKEGKQNTELAKGEEEVQLNEAVEYLENLGGNGTPTNPEIPTETKTVEEMQTAKTYMPAKTTLKDSNDNLIVVPEGFKIADDSGINVTEGIVIEDNDKTTDGKGELRGNQYVWIPVGENIKKQNEKDGIITISEVDITLGRYVFADGTNHKDAEGYVLSAGTPILKQSADNYEDETEISVKDIFPKSSSTYVYKELKTNRPGVAKDDLTGENATALNLKGFIDSVKANGGYYIARYEASFGVDRKANSKVSIGTPATSSSTKKTEGMLWNYITQLDAAEASRDLYKDGEKVTVNSDLMNSYAWDTAIVYIQAFSGDTDYSRQNSKNTSLANTGVNGDEVCKINDMASNTLEWTTEYSPYTSSGWAYPCTSTGGYFAMSDFFTSRRFYYTALYSNSISAFRPALYM